METKLRVLSCYVFPILTYGSEYWEISKSRERRLEAAEMWFYWWILHISLMHHISNEEKMRRIGRDGLLLSTIKMWQLNFFSHIIWKDSLPKVFLTGKHEGKRDCGKQSLHIWAMLEHDQGWKQKKVCTWQVIEGCWGPYVMFLALLKITHVDVDVHTHCYNVNICLCK